MQNLFSGPRRSTTARYAAAIAATGVCSLVPLLVHPDFDDVRLPFVALIPAIALSAWLGGFGPGIVSTLLAVFVAEMVWSQAGTGALSAHDWLALCLLACMGVLLSLLDGFIHRALANARRSMERAEHEAAERTEAEQELHARVRQQAAVAELGQRALAGEAVSTLLDAAVVMIHRMLSVDCTKVLELQPGGENLLLRAGHGWKPGVVGQALVSAGIESQAGYTLLLAKDEPLLVDDLREETRFKAPPLLVDHGIVSGMSVVIPGPHRPYGVLGVHCRVPRTFSRDDANFVQAVANILATAIAREHIESERDTSLAAAQNANRLKDDFLATLSHEIRTPLNAILGWASLVHSGKVNGPRLGQAIEAIMRNAQAQAQIVSDLLDVSRIITGKLPLQTEEVEIAPVVHDVIESLQPAASAKGLHLTLVAAPRDVRLVADRLRLQQIVWNLVSNAIKFTPPGGSIEIHANVEDRQLELVVRDSGVGIEADFLPHVFDRFSQADSSSTRVHGGLGLGLAIVRHLVELHGGTVAADSPGEGKGATFTVRLPVRAPVSRAVVLPTAGATPVCSTVARQTLRGLDVLVVDDDRDGRDMLTVILEQAGAGVTRAASAEEALARFRVAPPALLVSDIAMPHVDGCTLMRQIRALPPAQGGRVTAVAVTACASATDRERALAAGYDMYFVKPLLVPEFLAALAVLAGRGEPA